MTPHPIDAKEHEAVVDAIVQGRVTWCRARLLHALAGEAKQGVLREVLDELVDDGSRISDAVADALRQGGWLAPADE